MAETFSNRLKSAWNAFMNRDPPNYKDLGMSYSYRSDRLRVMSGNEKTIITAIYNKMAMDCSAIEIIHAKLDENDRYVSPMSSGLNMCLTLSANKDQTARAFRQDVVMSMFDEGCVAVVPIDTTTDRRDPDAYDVYSMRVGKIIQWYPDYVRVRVYNDWRGCTEDITLPKAKVAIIENPLYAVMNEPNSVVQRLKRKLSLLDAADEQSTSGRLDMIIQLPYVIKTEARRAEANKRRQEIEEQLNNSKYGIAYADGTERIIQLNRPVENNLMSQIEYLTNMVYSQLGITQEIMNGTADEKTMQNYYSRSIEPIISAIVEEMRRKFLTDRARSEHVSIVFFRDPFKLIPVSAIADIADKFTRNEILSSNEIRQVIGRKPVDDPKADELRNKNLNAGEGQDFANTSQNKEELTPSEKSAG